MFGLESVLLYMVKHCGIWCKLKDSTFGNFYEHFSGEYKVYLDTVVYRCLHEAMIVTVSVFGRIRPNMSVIRDVYRCKRSAVSLGYDMVNNGRNTVHTKCMFHGPVYGRNYDVCDR